MVFIDLLVMVTGDIIEDSHVQAVRDRDDGHVRGMTRLGVLGCPYNPLPLPSHPRQITTSENSYYYI